jgi:hypothetical protein
MDKLRGCPPDTCAARGDMAQTILYRGDVARSPPCHARGSRRCPPSMAGVHNPEKKFCGDCERFILWRWAPEGLRRRGVANRGAALFRGRGTGLKRLLFSTNALIKINHMERKEHKGLILFTSFFKVFIVLAPVLCYKTNVLNRCFARWVSRSPGSELFIIYSIS